MENNTSSVLKTDQLQYAVALVLFLFITIWYYYIHGIDTSSSEPVRQLWGSAYQIMAIFGGFVGLSVAGKWGYRSLIGRAVMFFSIGLLLQSFGQSVSSYYNFFANQAIPYPSLGDIGFLGSVLAYIAGAYTLLKSTGFKYSIKSVKGKFLAIGVPLVLLVSSYWFFLRGYQFDWSNQVKIFLDFGYPFGQAIYVSIALMAYLISRNYLGGIMRRPIVFFIFALALQYFADFTFLYQANAGTWHVGGLNDFYYFCSYGLMAFALINIGSVRQKIAAL
jgi:hypothetical protein